MEEVEKLKRKKVTARKMATTRMLRFRGIVVGRWIYHIGKLCGKLTSVKSDVLRSTR